MNNNDNNDGVSKLPTTTLGDYYFDELTGCGDIIEINNKQYKVKKSNCQYKYETNGNGGGVGGGRGNGAFNMVRKILIVQPLDRVLQEEYIMKQYSISSSS